MAYQSGESGIEEIYITTFPAAQGKWQVSFGGGAWPRWSADGGRLYYRRERDVMVVEVDTDPAIRMGTPAKLFAREFTRRPMAMDRPQGFDVSADGRFLFVRSVENDDDAREATGITLVENWFSEFHDSR